MCFVFNQLLFVKHGPKVGVSKPQAVVERFYMAGAFLIHLHKHCGKTCEMPHLKDGSVFLWPFAMCLSPVLLFYLLWECNRSRPLSHLSLGTAQPGNRMQGSAENQKRKRVEITCFASVTSAQVFLLFFKCQRRSKRWCNNKIWLFCLFFSIKV